MKPSRPVWSRLRSRLLLPSLLLLAAPLFAAPNPPGTTPTPVNPLQFRRAGPVGGRVADLSDNGTAVVGRAADGSGFRWRMSDGTVLVGYPASDPTHGDSPARGVTATGGVVMGWDVGVQEAYLWTPATGTVSTDFHDIPNAISADGGTIVGGQIHPRRWTAATGMEGIGAGVIENGTATDVSADGSYIVGGADFYAYPGWRAFRWHARTGVMNLGKLAAYESTRALGVSGNGAVVVGYAYNSNGGSNPEREAFRWTHGTGLVGLGKPPFADNSTARDVSADGVLIVGEANVPFVGPRAILWDPVHGMRYLQLVLEDYGLGSKLQGWTLLRAVAVASDADTITFAGDGTTPEGETQGWWARVTQPLP